MTQRLTPPLQPRVTAYYSNGAYGRTWGVRQVLEVISDGESGVEIVRFKGIAGTCRRKTGHCSLEDFRKWARYEVALNENSWHRVGNLEEEFPEAEV